jgi:hypothetical protein
MVEIEKLRNKCGKILITSNGKIYNSFQVARQTLKQVCKKLHSE